MDKISRLPPVDSHSLSSFKSLSKGISLFVTGVGCLVLIGWAWDIAALKSILPGLASMKSNTALLFVLCGISLWMQVEGKSRRIAQACAFMVALVGLLTLGEYVFNGDLGIDQVLFRDTAINALHPGRMSPATALGFLLIGIALMFLDHQSRNRFTEPFVILAFANSTLAFIGYLYGVSSLYQIGVYSSMALHTALSFILLSLGVLFAQPERGLMQTILADTAGGNILRRLLLVVLVGPVLLGWLRLWGQRAGLYDTAFGLAIMVTLLITTLTIFIWFNARQLTAIDIKRRQIDYSLRESEERFRLMVEQIADYAIFMLDAEGTILNWNVGAERMKGYKEAEIVGQHISRFYTSEQNVEGKAAQHLRQAEAEGHLIDENWRVRKDGSRFWAEVTITALKDKHGNLRGFSKITHDLTVRRQAEERFRLAIESAPNAIIMVDQHGQIILVNSQAEKYFGYDRLEFMTKSIDNLVPVRFLGNHANHRAGFFSQLQARAMGVGRDLFGLRKDGSEFPVEIGLAPINTQEGILVLATIVDITERKKREEETRKLEERFSIAFRASPAGLTITTLADGTFVDVNESYLQMLGYHREEVIGHTAVELNMLSAEERAKPIQQLREHGHIRNIELQLQAKSGRLFNVLFSSEQIELNGTACALTIVVDITERKRAEIEILKLNAELEEKINRRTAELAEANEQLHQLSILDELTGLYNRRGFLLLAQEQFLLAQRARRNLLVFYADLDGLKQINDQLGHGAGDKAIAAAARALNETFRTSDIKARLGGDEFIVLAMEAKEDCTHPLLARLHQKLAEKDQSMSVGVVTFDAQNETSIEDLIVRADEAMYVEKRKKTGQAC